MDWFAKFLYPRSQPHFARRKLKVLVGVIVVGLLTAAAIGFGLYRSSFQHGGQ
jgi:hypothetical protein